MIGRRAPKKSYEDIVVNNLTQTSTTITNNKAFVAHPTSTITAHPDSGATGTYIMPSENLPEKSVLTLKVGCPNGQNIYSTSIAQLNIPNVPANANKARVFKDLNSGNLLSIGQLCDNGCEAIFQPTKVTIKNKNNQTVLEGPRDPVTKLWTINIPTATQAPCYTKQPTHQHQANGIIRKKTTQSDLTIFYHATLGASKYSALLKAIDLGFLTTFPGLTSNLVKNTYPWPLKQPKVTLTNNDNDYNHHNKTLILILKPYKNPLKKQTT